MSDLKVQQNQNWLGRVGHVVALPVIVVVGATAWIVRRLWSAVHPSSTPTAPVNPRREEKQRRKSLWKKAA
jgi:hypothetical protein